MATTGADVVVIGGGVAGIATAYYLGKAGVKSTVLERDSVGSHASGFAYGGLAPLGGAGIPGPNFPVSLEGARLHHQLSLSLPEETGVNTEYRLKALLSLAFTEEEATAAKAGIAWQARQGVYLLRWINGAEAREIEPRISDQVLGAVHTEGLPEVESYRFVLALAQAAEKLGATIRNGRATGISREGGRVTAVVTESGDIACDRVVVAMGPWSGETSSWLGMHVEVGPMKGQILHLRAPEPPTGASVSWAGNYATTKPDGLLWAGTTEEEVGFDDAPTTEARDEITAALLKMVPSMDDAQLVQQTACLRPLSADMLPLLGRVPGWENVYVATGAGRKGILLGPAMGRAIADLVTRGETDLPIAPFDPGRSAR